MEEQKTTKNVDIIKNYLSSESIMTMPASEDVLRKEWDNKMDERWNNV